MSNLTTYTPPKLAILEAKKKIRDYSETERNQITFRMIEKLLNLLGVNDGKQEHHKTLHAFINEMYTRLTYEEINEAFNLCVAGEFNIKPFQQLNSVVFGQVIAAFEVYKKEKLYTYRQKLQKEKAMIETPKEEKEFIMLEASDRIFRDYKQHKKITEACNHVYDYLFNKGLLPTDKDIKIAIFERAKVEAKSEAMRDAGIDYEQHRQLKETLERITVGKSDAIVIIAKRLSLEQYFKTLIKENKDIKQVI